MRRIARKAPPPDAAREPSMRTSQSNGATPRRASNGALRAVASEHDSEHDIERDVGRDIKRGTAGLEPFDDIGEPGAQDHADSAHDSNGIDSTAHEPLSPDDPLAPLPFNPYKGNRGLTRAWHAMKNSLAGFRVAIREESAFRQELTLAAILIPCGLLVPVEPVSRVLLLGSVLLVLIVELLNSSVEAAIDRISLERHELSRRAKDLGSAAVMVALGMCVMTWALIVGPLLARWLRAWL
jgi:diacylglycerol kinase (ATP)